MKNADLIELIGRAGSLCNGELSFRLRHGDVVIDGETRARSFTLATDAGGIRVTGVIDASGAAGATIHLAAKQDPLCRWR